MTATVIHREAYPYAVRTAAPMRLTHATGHGNIDGVLNPACPARGIDAPPSVVRLEDEWRHPRSMPQFAICNIQTRAQRTIPTPHTPAFPSQRPAAPIRTAHPRPAHTPVQPCYPHGQPGVSATPAPDQRRSRLTGNPSPGVLPDAPAAPKIDPQEARPPSG